MKVETKIKINLGKPKKHVLKIEEHFYRSIVDGTLNFNLRKNDRDYEVDDIVVFRPYSCESGEYGPESFEYIITTIIHHTEVAVGEDALNDGYCVFGFKRRRSPRKFNL